MDSRNTKKKCCLLCTSCKYCSNSDDEHIGFLESALSTVTRQKTVKNNRTFKDMNDILNAWIEGRNVQLEYICIDETLVNWDTRHKLLPFKLCLPDYINKESKLTKTSSH